MAGGVGVLSMRSFMHSGDGEEDDDGDDGDGTVRADGGASTAIPYVYSLGLFGFVESCTKLMEKVLKPCTKRCCAKRRQSNIAEKDIEQYLRDGRVNGMLSFLPSGTATSAGTATSSPHGEGVAGALVSDAAKASAAGGNAAVISYVEGVKISFTTEALQGGGSASQQGNAET